jgi:hypothetical protein
MGIDPEIANEELEALLAGYGREKNLDLTRFVDDLSTAFPAHAPASAAHLAAIAHEAQLLTDKGDPVARPASNAVAPAPQASRPPKRWRNTMKDKKARILIKIAAPIVALFAVLGIMGSAGALPRTLQNLTSNAAGVVGLNLPTAEDEGNDTTVDDQGDQNEQGDDIKDATDEGDQGDTTSTDTSDQGDQNDQGDASTSDSSDQGDQNEGDSTDSSTGSDQGDQGDQNDQGDSSGSSTGSDQGDQNDQGDSTGTSGGGSGGSSENDQGDGGSSQDDQGDTSGDSGSSGSGDNQN